MGDLTPNTDILKELPEDYTSQTALADLIDNSLQAVWSNEVHVKHISVDVSDDIISIFDTGPGMDGAGENSIEKWGKMGASLHRKFKKEAIGGTPPYLKPFFGMFGYGGPLASMKLGRRAIVSSKTKESKKVYTLNLDRDTILTGSSWKTEGGMKEPQEAEISMTPSFTKVEPRSTMAIYQLQCKLKDIYYPYIQHDERPVKFEVNGVDLAKFGGGEIAITNSHSCNGPHFVLQLQFSFKKDCTSDLSDVDSGANTKANARLKCVYFPVVEGHENIERVLEVLQPEGCRTPKIFETYSRVSIRSLGRLLPDARWAWLPFMDLKQKRGDNAELFSKCCMRVKCFIDTDAGFEPNQSKTDLERRSPFTSALKNFCNKPPEIETDVNVQIYRDGKVLNPSQLKRDYEEWILQMHGYYDDALHGTLLMGWVLTTEIILLADTREMIEVQKSSFIDNECFAKVKKITESIYFAGAGRSDVFTKFFKKLRDFVHENQNPNLDAVAAYGLTYIQTDRDMDVANTGFLLAAIENGQPKLIKITNSNIQDEKKMHTCLPGCEIEGSGKKQVLAFVPAPIGPMLKQSEAQILAEKGVLNAALKKQTIGGVITMFHLSEAGIGQSRPTVMELLLKYYDQLHEFSVGNKLALGISYGNERIKKDSIKIWFWKGPVIKDVALQISNIIGDVGDKGRIWFLAFDNKNSPQKIISTIRSKVKGKNKVKDSKGKGKYEKGIEAFGDDEEINQIIESVFANCPAISIDQASFRFVELTKQAVELISKLDKKEREKRMDFVMLRRVLSKDQNCFDF